MPAHDNDMKTIFLKPADKGFDGMPVDLKNTGGRQAVPAKIIWAMLTKVWDGINMA